MEFPSKLHFPATAQKSFRASELTAVLPFRKKLLQLSNCREALKSRKFFQFIITTGELTANEKVKIELLPAVVLVSRGLSPTRSIVSK